MKYLGSVNLWNAGQWFHCWRLHNLCSVHDHEDYVTISALGFVFFFDVRRIES